MKYIAKELQENVNISKESPVKDFFVLTSGVIGIILVIYVFLGYLSYIIAPWIPDSVERRLFNDRNSISTIQDERASRLMANLLDVYSDKRELNYKVSVKNTPIINAYAYPGGEISLTSELLKNYSDKYISFVIAHELGHIHNRDHFKQFSRTALIHLILAMMGFENSDWLASSTVVASAKFSQSQEIAADNFALELIKELDIDPEIAVLFFESLEENKDSSVYQQLFSSHPHPLKRIENVKKYIGR